MDMMRRTKSNLLKRNVKSSKKHERGVSYREALNLPEGTLDEILAKIEAVKKEGEKIGYINDYYNR